MDQNECREFYADWVAAGPEGHEACRFYYDGEDEGKRTYLVLGLKDVVKANHPAWVKRKDGVFTPVFVTKVVARKDDFAMAEFYGLETFKESLTRQREDESQPQVSASSHQRALYYIKSLRARCRDPLVEITLKDLDEILGQLQEILS